MRNYHPNVINYLIIRKQLSLQFALIRLT